MEDIKYNMEDQVKREYIEPLRGIQSVELKEINVCFFPCVFFWITVKICTFDVLIDLLSSIVRSWRDVVWTLIARSEKRRAVSDFELNTHFIISS